MLHQSRSDHYATILDDSRNLQEQSSNDDLSWQSLHRCLVRLLPEGDTDVALVFDSLCLSVVHWRK
jgi:hypothetical protein